MSTKRVSLYEKAYNYLYNLPGRVNLDASTKVEILSAYRAGALSAYGRTAARARYRKRR